jgi:hypothetical protein
MVDGAAGSEAKEQNLIKVMLQVNKAKEQFIPTPIPSSNLTSCHPTWLTMLKLRLD